MKLSSKVNYLVEKTETLQASFDCLSSAVGWLTNLFWNFQGIL